MNGQRYPQQKLDLGEFPRQNTGEIKWLYGFGISDKIPPQTHSSPPAEVMASSKRSNKQEQPLLFHCWSSCARVEPSALRLNQYKCCALQPRTCLFRLSVIVSHRAVIGFNKQLHLSKKPLVRPAMHQWQDGWFPPPQQSIKTPAGEFRQITGKKEGLSWGQWEWGTWSREKPAECGVQ